MSLILYNSLTRRKEPFEPIEPGKVKMYVCGITAYNYFHVGNARAFMIFDVMRRYLMWQGYEVRYVQNFTDVDDKILKRAIAEGSTMEAIAEEYIAAYFEDADRLNILRADSYPRATHLIDGMQRLIHELEQRHYAYAAGGDVYYSVRQFADYGKLSGRKLEDMQTGASGRVDDEDSEKKKDPADFALWKAAKPGEPAWESPWGRGRPGWHLECSAMVRQEFGDSIDIHAGGQDLTFPHHENEIAQSEAVTGKPLARYWLHNGFINMDGEKMSKSLGNFRLTRDLLTTCDPMAFRLFVLQAHYRKPVDFTAEGLKAAASGWQTLKEAFQAETQFSTLPGWSVEAVASDSAFVDRFNQAMNDDFNTPIALSVIFELAKELRREGNVLVHQGQPTMAIATLQHYWQTFVQLAQVLGLENQVDTTVTAATLTDEQVEAAIQARRTAKNAKNFAEADRIRDELTAQGVAIFDKPGGITDWHRI